MGWLPENLFYKLYAWILIGMAFANKTAYISCCQLIDLKAVEMGNISDKFRFVLCRVMISMCPKAIRGRRLLYI